LLKLNIPFTVLLQPQARVKRHVQLENYKTYQRICARYCRRESEALDLFKPNIETNTAEINQIFLKDI